MGMHKYSGFSVLVHKIGVVHADHMAKRPFYIAYILFQLNAPYQITFGTGVLSLIRLPCGAGGSPASLIETQKLLLSRGL